MTWTSEPALRSVAILSSARTIWVLQVASAFASGDSSVQVDELRYVLRASRKSLPQPSIVM